MAVESVHHPKVVYLIEKPAPPAPHHPVWIDRVKHIAGIALVMIGLGLLFGAALATAGYFSGFLTLAVETIHPFYMSGITCAIGGFHLVKGSSSTPSIEISAGPIAVTI